MADRVVTDRRTYIAFCAILTEYDKQNAVDHD